MFPLSEQIHQQAKGSRACQPAELGFMTLLSLNSQRTLMIHKTLILKYFWHQHAVWGQKEELNVWVTISTSSMDVHDYIFFSLWCCFSSRGNGVKGSFSVCGQVIFKFHENGAEYTPHPISKAFIQSSFRLWIYYKTPEILHTKFDWHISSDVTITYQYLVLL